MCFNVPDSQVTRWGRRWRIFSAVVVFLIVPVILMFIYDGSGLWNPFLGVDEDGDPVRLITHYMGFLYWGGLWLVHKAAITPICMPKELKQVCLEFKKAEETYKTWRYSHYASIEKSFFDDLIKRTDVYLRACKKASAEEVALSALSDIALDLNFKELHALVFDRLEEIEATRPRLERILAYR